ncbi:tripartite tricarboxylate transporter substrate binding protein [Cupriavidus sp. IDO]|uniref:tripartite tricarboxylate transporter substrate binding protein n=1 Tax=Cupriavidus sp. IDO TaxID=1539142 RepID=UPI0005795D37|nr:tripartite tricarboxylate transporter substrate binding protein [Cupriavidus sp. IDO]KWR88484.1 LacI family transcriptional regulator [Cupriavidus sp. IDO]
MFQATKQVGRLVAMALLCAAAAAHGAQADAYPSKPVRVIVPYAVGGGGDIVGRPLALYLSQRTGQRFIMDNHGGANGNIGMDMVAKAPNDGYTLVLALTAQLAVNRSLYRNLSYDPVKDFEPVSLLASAPYFLVVHPSVPARNLAEFIKLARANPGKYTYGSSGNGSGPHLSMELLKSKAGIDLVHVPFKGAGPAMPALLAGQVSAMFASYGLAAQQIKAGKLRVLAVSTANRAVSMPDVPTIAEAGVPGYESNVWYALMAPRGTPKPIITRLSSEIAGLIKSSDLRQRFLTDGIVPVGSTPEELGAYIKTESAKWEAVVKQSGASID